MSRIGRTTLTLVCTLFAAAEGSIAVAQPPLGIATESFGSKSVDAAGTDARFWKPQRLTSDGTTAYVSDTGNHTIRAVSLSDGRVWTLAGSPGLRGSADGRGSSSRFNSPLGISMNGGFLYVADSGNSAVRRVDRITGEVTTIAGRAGERGYADGLASAARFWKPSGIATSGSGSALRIYVTDSEAHTVRMIDSGTVSTLAGQGGSSGSLDGSGPGSRFNGPSGVVVDGAGNVYVADKNNHVIRKIDRERQTVATMPLETRPGYGFIEPTDLAGGGGLDGFYVLDRKSTVYFVNFDGTVTFFETTVADGITSLRPGTKDGVLWVSAKYNDLRKKVTGQTASVDVAGKRPAILFKNGAADANGGVFHGTRPVARFDPATGVSTTIATTGPPGGPIYNYYSMAATRDGLFIASDGVIYRVDLASGEIRDFAGKLGQYGAEDGAGTAARVSNFGSMASDGQGNLFTPDTFNCIIRRVSERDASVTTIAGKLREAAGLNGPAALARFNGPVSVAHDKKDNLYIGENGAIRKLNLTTNEVSTLAGITGQPGFVDGRGEVVRIGPAPRLGLMGSTLFFSDQGNEATTPRAIRALDLTTGAVTTVAGHPLEGGLDDGMGDGARLSFAAQLIPLPDGRILVLDDAVPRYAAEVAQAPFFVPVVLSSEGLNHSFFTTELTLTNRSLNEVSVRFSYTAASGGGSGSFTDPVVLGPGRQQIIPDAIEFLASRGLKVASSGPRHGTLWVTLQGASGSDASVSARTTTPVTAENLPDLLISTAGRAGLAYAGVRPAGLLTGTAYLSGLRVTDDERSNVAVQNAGTDADGAISVRISLFAGDGNGTPAGTQEFSIPPGGFAQARVESLTGEPRSNQGYFAKTERLSGTAPYYAYGVINDNATSDGSLVTPYVPGGITVAGLTLPVALEASPYSTEVILNNFSAVEKRARITFAATAIAGGEASMELNMPPGSQRLLPDFVDVLRNSGAAGVGPAGPGFIGPVFVTASTGDIDGLAVSAKTTNPNPAGAGKLGLYYQGVPFGSTSAAAWISGLQQDARNRSNIALVNTGEKGGSPVSLKIEYFSGETGAKVGERTQTVPARQLVNMVRVLASDAPGVPQGYAKITRVDGDNPFLAYGVVNDGSEPGLGTGDGAFLLCEK
ncbi:MAG: hypothetical protein L6R30_18220 [Thermoanaerobaculia bacterium]|nr:hypothetical protein [Thermoanaerobaculia bacterium]